MTPETLPKKFIIKILSNNHSDCTVSIEGDVVKVSWNSNDYWDKGYYNGYSINEVLRYINEGYWKIIEVIEENEKEKEDMCENIPKGCKPFNLEAALNGGSVVTRDGRDVTEIHLFKTKCDYPLMTIINGDLYTFEENGKYSVAEEHSLDLFMKSQKKEGWVNVYDDGVVSHIYPTKDAAEMDAWSGLVDTVKIEWEE